MALGSWKVSLTTEAQRHRVQESKMGIRGVMRSNLPDTTELDAENQEHGMDWALTRAERSGDLSDYRRRNRSSQSTRAWTARISLRRVSLSRVNHSRNS